MTDDARPDKLPAEITITLPRAVVEDISHGLSDLLCWTAGFMSARSDDCSTHPIGVEECRQLNIILKKKLRDAR